MDASWFFTLGAAIILVGIIAVILAIFLSSTNHEQHEQSTVKGAGVIMIGPIPIIFGTDKKSATLVVALSLVLMIVLIIYYLIVR
jgi:uncharacterized protein (TIGR00304 family)